MKIFVLKPAEAPPGVQRLLPFLQKSLTNDQYNECHIMVAFARLSGVARLLPQIRIWKSGGNVIEAIVGIDRYGTSSEALEIMLDELDAVYITQTSDQSCIFHPKMYLFKGPEQAQAIVGSHNLTCGGLETNFEGGVIMDFELPAENAMWGNFVDVWDQLLPAGNPCTRKLDELLLNSLIESGHLLPEARVARLAREAAAGVGGPSSELKELFPYIAPAPPSPISKDLLKELRPGGVAKKKTEKPTAVKRTKAIEGLPRGLVIEIIPHPNGEIFLSKRAADLFPSFLGMPFTGQTVPKKAANPSYPMRVPDPNVLWSFYDKNGKLVHREQFGLNTVLYERKSEIRITVSPSLAKAMPKFSIMVMRGGASALPPGLDYVIEVFAPGSPGWTKWEPAMNVTLPGGGRARPRRMGWI